MTTTTTTPTPPTPGPPTPATPRWQGASTRRAWIVGGSVVTVVMLVFALLQVLSWIARETTTTETLLTAEQLQGVRTVEISNDVGSVNVVGTDDDTARITSEVSRGLLSPTNEWHLDGDRLVITSRCPPVLNDHCEVDHDVEVPRDLAVILDLEDGAGRVSDVDGGTQVRSDHSTVELIRVGGAVRADMDHGHLRSAQLTAATVSATTDHGDVSLEFATTPQRLVVSSDHGDVDISVPDEPGSFAVTVSTRFGRASNALRTDPASSSTIDVRSEFGRITLGYTP